MKRMFNRTVLEFMTIDTPSCWLGLTSWSAVAAGVWAVARLGTGGNEWRRRRSEEGEV